MSTQKTKQRQTKTRGGKPPSGPGERDESDLFIAEVTEELQRDRAYKLFRRIAPFALGGIVLIVGAAAVNEYLSATATREARAAGGVLFDAIALEDPNAAITALRDGANGLESGAAMVARLNAAALAAQEGDGATAAEIYDAVAADAEPGSVYQDLARLRATMHRLETASPSESIEALKPLTEDGRPFRALALELLGAARIRSGDEQGARAAFLEAYQDETAPPTLRDRAARLLVGAGGEDPRRAPADGAAATVLSPAEIVE